MTTGRINQVTIFVGPSPVRVCGPGPRGGAELVSGRGKTTRSSARPRRESRGSHRYHPFATTEFSRTRSAKDPTERIDRPLAYPPQMEAPLSPVTSQGRLPEHERTPECVGIMMASGQQSTGSFSAGRQSNRPGFGYSMVGPWGRCATAHSGIHRILSEDHPRCNSAHAILVTAGVGSSFVRRGTWGKKKRRRLTIAASIGHHCRSYQW
jgi:hypothetical protein